MNHDLPLLTLIAAAFTAAWVFGVAAKLCRLSPIVGYLIGGIAIGGFTPGFRGDPTLAGQLAELGVILLMFGVGLHFHLKDLLAVKNIAIPGAVGQALAATLLGFICAELMGMDVKGGLVLGMALAVASTVVLIRVLTDNKLMETQHGHVAVGWLIVEDILTVVVLMIIPALGSHIVEHGPTTQTAVDAAHAVTADTNIFKSLALAAIKFVAMVAVVLVGGGYIIPRIMLMIAKLRSRELFTLTVLAIAIGIAVGSHYVFDVSMALGAFLAGMVVGQTSASHQAAADALPLRDAFAVLFFVSIGMVFDPNFIINHPGMLAIAVGIVMVGKPIAAMIIIAVIGYPLRTGLVVALGLAQIGEFSFIVAQLGRDVKILDNAGYNAVVAAAIISITLNPILFAQLPRIETWIAKYPRLNRLLNRRGKERESQANEEAAALLEQSDKPLAAVLGFGPVGRTVDRVLRESGMETVVIDLNIDTIEKLTKEGRAAIFGDAYNLEVMGAALGRVTHLIITLPHAVNRNPLIASAKLINPEVKVFVRARYLAEREELVQVGADAVIFEEGEVAVALARMVLADRGVDHNTILEQTVQIRGELNNATPAL